MVMFNENAFRVKFRAFLAVIGFLSAIGFMFTAVLNPIAQKSEFTGIVLGFMTGTLLTLVFTYYFGNSESAKPPEPIEPEIEPE